jgi:cyclophilin family peptidyl-prolyl cis-trans isomerase
VCIIFDLKQLKFMNGFFHKTKLANYQWYFIFLILAGCSSLKKVPPYVEPTTGRIVQVQTEYGNITIALSDSTPLHRNNFIALVKEKFYDSLLFHRVMNGFMIQGGDPSSKTAPAGMQLGGGGKPYTVPAELKPYLFHKRGALAAARRTDSPEKASSSCQFYIVHGKKWTDEELNTTEQTRLGGRKLADSVRTYYKTIGGTPQLDMNYTVYGQVTEGLNIIDSIAAQPRDGSNRPLKDVRMKVVIIR